MVDNKSKSAIMSLPAKVSSKSNRLTGNPQRVSFTNSLQNYLGLEMARAARYLRRLLDTLAGSTNENSAGRFYLPRHKKTSWPGAGNTQPTLTKANPEEIAMAENYLNISPDDASNFDHLSEAELSSLIDLLTSQIEYHRDELTRLKPILHRLQDKIPNDSFEDFIDSL